jgi:RNA processing factor Prp31
MQDVNRQDKPIIQAIALIEQLDKNINTFVMRLKEWYSWHFPELAKIVSDNAIYTRLVNFLQKRDNANEENREKIEEITLDAEKTTEIIEAAKTSMGQDLADIDVDHIKHFSDRAVDLILYRVKVGDYLKSRMTAVAPNLATLIGENVGAKLISHAGSLVSLAKYPASTI